MKMNNFQRESNMRKNTETLEGIFRQLANELRAQYLVEYYSNGDFPVNRYVDLDVGLTDLGDNGGVIWIDSDWQIDDVGNIDWWDEGRTSWVDVDVDVGPTFSGDNGGVIWELVL